MPCFTFCTFLTVFTLVYDSTTLYNFVRFCTFLYVLYVFLNYSTLSTLVTSNYFKLLKSLTFETELWSHFEIWLHFAKKQKVGCVTKLESVLFLKLLFRLESMKNPTKVFLPGIISWGYECAQADTPGVYTKNAHYLDWIHQTIHDNS